MMELTLFNFLLLIHEFLFIICLEIWTLLFKYDYFKSASPLFAKILKLIFNIGILGYMIIYDIPFIIYLIYLIYIIYKIYSINSLIIDYHAGIDYFSIIVTFLLIIIITCISIMTVIKTND